MTLEELDNELSMMSFDELSYTLGRYCGKKNMLLRDKKYGDAAEHLDRLVQRYFDSRAIDDFLLTDSLLSEAE
jgi:hypothetical protein